MVVVVSSDAPVPMLFKNQNLLTLLIFCPLRMLFLGEIFFPVK